MRATKHARHAGLVFSSQTTTSMAQAKRTSRTAPRKRPRQERSAATVDAILEGAARVFVAEGYDAATTNRIAESAGISVGSLYQYFPSKDAIAVELVRRFRASRVAFIRAELAGVGAKPLESVVKALFTSFLQAEGIRPELYGMLIERVLRTSARTELRGYEERLEALVVDAMRRVKPAPRVADPELAAFMLVRLVLALVHSVNADKPRYDKGAIASELTRLVVAYLGVQ
jgi:AcrR family transcriptional regulator